MAIYTAFGNKIKVLKADTESMMLRAERLEDKAVRFYHIGELKADGGCKEIMAAMNNAAPEKIPASNEA